MKSSISKQMYVWLNFKSKDRVAFGMRHKETFPPWGPDDGAKVPQLLIKGLYMHGSYSEF